jgi:predicted RNA-binding Zn-ribbon protein involved in translation (DUF1610 family)
MNPHQKPQEDVVGLLPCPFCGSEAEIERVGDHRQSTIYQCTSCSCSLETGEEWGHGRRWNTRATPTYEAGRRDMREAAGWQPIETAPKDGTAIIGYRKGMPCRVGNPPIAVISWFEDGFPKGWWGPTGDSVIMRYPTHWQALPTEPLGGEG